MKFGLKDTDLSFWDLKNKTVDDCLCLQSSHTKLRLTSTFSKKKTKKAILLSNLAPPPGLGLWIMAITKKKRCTDTLIVVKQKGKTGYMIWKRKCLEKRPFNKVKTCTSVTFRIISRSANSIHIKKKQQQQRNDEKTSLPIELGNEPNGL